MWASRGGATLVQLRQVRRVRVVAIIGRLDRSAVQPCRAALQLATDQHDPIIVDLGRAAPPLSVSVPLLGAMRRYAATRGAVMTLTEIPGPWATALKTARGGHPYEVTQSLPEALTHVAAFIHVEVVAGARPVAEVE